MATGHETEQPPVGGAFIRWRTEKRERQIPHTVDGETELVTEHYTVRTPRPPRDWDHIILRGVLTMATLLLVASIVWSTASIGDLLAITVPAAVAYSAAVAFDAAWISCMALEWLARYDRARARVAMWCGHVALVIAMTAVGVHGYRADSLPVALVGAAVAALAKGLWTVVLLHISPPLDDRDRQWIAARDGRLGAQLAVASRKRQHARAEGQHAALLAALGTPDPAPDHSGNDPGQSGDAPEESGPRPLAAGTVRAIVRASSDALGTRDVEAIVAHLRDEFDVQLDTATVRRALPDPEPDTGDVVRPMPGPHVLDTVNNAVSSGIRTLPEVLRIARSAHGQTVKEATVERYLRGALKERA